jgi:hypothetical protein
MVSNNLAVKGLNLEDIARERLTKEIDNSLEEINYIVRDQLKEYRRNEKIGNGEYTIECYYSGTVDDIQVKFKYTFNFDPDTYEVTSEGKSL